MPDSDRAIPADWEARVDELRKVQDLIAKAALLHYPAESSELLGWFKCARMLYNMIENRGLEINPMAHKPFTED